MRLIAKKTEKTIRYHVLLSLNLAGVKMHVSVFKTFHTLSVTCTISINTVAELVFLTAQFRITISNADKSRKVLELDRFFQISFCRTIIPRIEKSVLRL